MNQIGVGPIIIALFYRNHFFEGPVSKYSHIPRSKVYRLQHLNLRIGWGLGVETHSSAYNSETCNRPLTKLGSEIH